MDFGGRPVGTTSSPVALSIPLVVHLSDLPDDYVINVPPQMQGFPAPFALGSPTYPGPLIAAFGDVSASFRLIDLSLDIGQHFRLDTGDVLTTRGTQGRAAVNFHPVSGGPTTDMLRGVAANLAVTIPSGGFSGAVFQAFSNLFAGFMTDWLNQQLIYPLAGTGILEGQPNEIGFQGPQGSPGEKGDSGLQGPVGPQGQTGDSGPQGQKGDSGLQGPVGPRGSANENVVYAIRSQERPTIVGSAPVVLATLIVPAGSYVITGRVGVNNLWHDGPEPVHGRCSLSTGDSVSFKHSSARSIRDDSHHWPVILHDVVSFNQTTKISLLGQGETGDSLNRQPDKGWQSSDVILTAMRVQTINPVSFYGPVEIGFENRVGTRFLTLDQPVSEPIFHGLEQATPPLPLGNDVELANLRMELWRANQTIEGCGRENMDLRSKLSQERERDRGDK
jgi:hypothetical protein